MPASTLLPKTKFPDRTLLPICHCFSIIQSHLIAHNNNKYRPVSGLQPYSYTYLNKVYRIFMIQYHAGACLNTNLIKACMLGVAATCTPIAI